MLGDRLPVFIDGLYEINSEHNNANVSAEIELTGTDFLSREEYPYFCIGVSLFCIGTDLKSTALFISTQQFDLILPSIRFEEMILVLS